MSRQVTIAIVGDRDPSSPGQRATGASLDHSAAGLGLDVAHRWVPTTDLAAGARRVLAGDSGVWVAPGSPYASMAGALAAIRFAREQGVPLIGTCGGFQHVVIEFARSVLGYQDAQHAEYDPSASTLFVTPLSCSLAGRTMWVSLRQGSLAEEAYGAIEAVERYYCSFGLNPRCHDLVHSGGLRIVGTDAGGEARVVEIPEHPFFVGTLFLPQTGSTPERPHPLVDAFVRAAASHARSGAAQLSSAE
jgi:CTP synthase (UTP-ammonia lyase)